MTATDLRDRLTDAFLGGVEGTLEKCFDFAAVHGYAGFAEATTEQKAAAIASARAWLVKNGRPELALPQS